MKHHLLLPWFLFAAVNTGAQTVPCPFEYPDTPVNQARGVVGCTLQCDQTVTCPGHKPKPQNVGEAGACPEGKHWNPEKKSCRSCPKGTSWDSTRLRCFCPSGKFSDTKNQRCVSCPQNWSWDKTHAVCVCAPNVKAMWAGKSCLSKNPACASGSEWDATNKHCVAREPVKPKAALEREFSAQYEELRGGRFDTLSCHGTGQEICLSVLANGDAEAKKVILYEGVWPGWDRMLQAKVVEDVEFR